MVHLKELLKAVFLFRSRSIRLERIPLPGQQRLFAVERQRREDLRRVEMLLQRQNVLETLLKTVDALVDRLRTQGRHFRREVGRLLRSFPLRRLLPLGLGKAVLEELHPALNAGVPVRQDLLVRLGYVALPLAERRNQLLVDLVPAKFRLAPLNSPRSFVDAGDGVVVVGAFLRLIFAALVGKEVELLVLV